MLTAALITACVLADPMAIENGGIRIEVDPHLFVVCYVGIPGGENFLEAPVPEEDAKEGSEQTWVSTGGIHTDLIPYPGQDPSLRRGPAEVVEHSKDHIVLLGPFSRESKIRFKKEIRIYPGQAKASFTVTAITTQPTSRRMAIRNTVRVPRESEVWVYKMDGNMRLLAGAESALGSVNESNLYWVLPVPPKTKMEGVVLGAFVPRIVHHNSSGAWTRRIIDAPGQEWNVPYGCTFICLMDDKTETYASALQGEAGGLCMDDSLVLREVWTIEKGIRPK